MLETGSKNRALKLNSDFSQKRREAWKQPDGGPQAWGPKASSLELSSLQFPNVLWFSFFLSPVLSVPFT